MLSGDLSTLLTGRVIEIEIAPFSYDEAMEYLHVHNIIIDDFVNNYIKLGGYPLRFDMQNEEEVYLYLSQLYDAILNKDILKRNSDVEKEKFMKVAKYVLRNTGDVFSAKKVVQYLNDKNSKSISIQTVYNYVEKMKQAFLIRTIRNYYISGKEVLKNNEKIYAVDNGFRFINSNVDEYNIGKNVENIVLNEFISRGYTVYVGKTYCGEIDFVVFNNNKKCFVQVAYLMPDAETMKREFEAFKNIKDASPKYVFSLDTVDMSHNGITHINIIDYFMGKKDVLFT